MQPAVENFTQSLPLRLQECAEKVGGKRTLAQLAHISEAQLFRYINGKADLPTSRLLAIAAAAKVQPAWLLTGHTQATDSSQLHPPFREALLSNITQTLEELLIEYEKNFTPAQRAQAISFMYKALRHEEALRQEVITVSKPMMLGFVNFLVDIRNEEILAALNHAIDYFEYTPNTANFKQSAGEFSAFVNYIIRAYEYYYSSASGRAYFDRIGTQILPHTAKQLDEVVATAQKNLHQSALTVLDIGCGSGRDISYLHRHYHNLRVFGLDQADSALKICTQLMQREYLAANSVQKADVRTIPFPAAHFDLMLSRQTLYCLPYLRGSGLGVEALLQEVRRCLKPGGFFYVVSRYGSGTEYLPFCQYYNRTSFTDLVTQYGLEVVWFKEDNAENARGTSCMSSQNQLNKYNHIFRALVRKRNQP